jgi:tetratricopeptide (TPR) repeat protein
MVALTRALLAVACTLASLAAPLAAQQREGDEAWNQGRHDAARAAYEQVLAADSTAFRANLRIGVILSWQGKQDSALRFIARARRSEPTDVEARLIEAKVMAWARRSGDAIARYDSLLAEQPGLVEAELGRARARAWSGDLGGAERGYRAVLAAEPRNADALAGLGYVYHWQGREGPAARKAREALAADSSHQAGRELRDAVRAATRASTELSANWSNDSDHNTNFWQTAGASAPLGPGVRVFGSVGGLEASDPVRDASRVGGEAGLTWTIGDVQLTGAAGARRLMPDTAAARTAETYRGRLSWRPAPRFGLSVAYARYPFDEIASLMERELDLESVDAGFDATLARGVSLFGGGGGVWFSDGNHRSNVGLGVTQSVGSGLFVGAYGRTLAYERKGLGYFSPDRFRLLEGVAGYNLDSGRWDGRLSGGLGAQQIGRAGVAQTEWHVDARLGRRWGTGNRIDVFGAVTNSAVSSTSGAFRYRTAGVVLRLGL